MGRQFFQAHGNNLSWDHLYTHTGLSVHLLLKHPVYSCKLIRVFEPKTVKLETGNTYVKPSPFKVIDRILSYFEADPLLGDDLMPLFLPEWNPPFSFELVRPKAKTFN